MSLNHAGAEEISFDKPDFMP